MAQGFVKNNNLRESDNTSSDRSILDNLGGINITSDILLFDGNSKFTSILRNNSIEIIEQDLFFGDMVAGKTYIVAEVGDSHDWNSVGAGASPSAGTTFTASGTGEGDTGTGGIVKETFIRTDFEVFVDPATGSTVRVIGNNKVAFSNGTIIAIHADDAEATSYDYKIHNSDGEQVFQVIAKTDNSNTPTIIDISSLGVSMTDITLTRQDTITTENINNMKVVKLSTNEEAEGEGGGVTLAEEGSGVDESDESDPLTPQEQISYIGSVIGKVKFKKSRVPVNFEPNSFSIRFRLDGLMRIVNSSNLEVGFTRRLNTGLVELVEYEIIYRGDAPNSFFDTVSGTTKAGGWQLGDKFTTIVGSSSQTHGGSTEVKATNPPGLFIVNSGNKVRAFSGTDNPWSSESQSFPFTSGVDTLTAASTTTTVEVRKLILSDRATGTYNTNPRLMKMASSSTYAPQVGSETIPVADFTHKLPIVVNGEQFYILAKKS